MGRSILVAAALALTACASPVAPPAAVRVDAMGPEAAAPDRSLYLIRYTIPPGTTLPPHFHDGTVIGLIESGTLTYTVLTGEVPVWQRGADGRPEALAPVRAGETREVHAGQWLVEAAADHHYGANRGTVPLVIVTSSLLAAGAPLATLLAP